MDRYTKLLGLPVVERSCFRAEGEQAWQEALPLWLDTRTSEYRGSIVRLPSGKAYEIRLSLSCGGPSAELKAATWPDTFPVARTVEVQDLAGRTLSVDDSGAGQGYVLYTHRPGAVTATIDGADKVDQCVEVRASYVILRSLTIKSPKIHGIVLGKGSHDVLIERCDISGWGRVDKDGWGVDYDSAVYSKSESLTQVIIHPNNSGDTGARRFVKAVR